MYSDVAEEGGRLTIGWIVFLPGGNRSAGAAVISDKLVAAFDERECQIHMGEALAALSAVYSCWTSLRGLRVLHFVDNQGALANLIAGSAGSMDVAGVVGWYQILTVSGHILPWFEYVESHLNLADVPSRLLDKFVEDPLARALGITEVLPARLPPLEDFLSFVLLLLLSQIADISS